MEMNRVLISSTVSKNKYVLKKQVGEIRTSVYYFAG